MTWQTKYRRLMGGQNGIRKQCLVSVSALCWQLTTGGGAAFFGLRDSWLLVFVTRLRALHWTRFSGMAKCLNRFSKARAGPLHHLARSGCKATCEFSSSLTGIA